MDIQINELFLIFVLRHFDNFLYQLGYRTESLVYNDRDGDSIIYSNRKRKILFSSYTEAGILNFNIYISKNTIISQTNRCFNILDYFKAKPDLPKLETFVTPSNIDSVLSNYHYLMSKHLVPILENKAWPKSISFSNIDYL